MDKQNWPWLLSCVYWLVCYAVELATLTREGEGDKARTVVRVLPSEEVDVLIKRYLEAVEAKKKEDKEKEREREARKE